MRQEPASRPGRRRAMVERTALAAALCALVLLAGCADDSATPAGAPGTATTPASSGSSAPAPTPSLDPGGDLVTPTKGAGLMTVRGTVSEGVEAGCLLLSSGGVVYQLQGAAARDLKAGQQVEVEGKVEQGMLSTCQQGTIFTVTAVRPG
jgi:hypothetical protein